MPTKRWFEREFWAAVAVTAGSIYSLWKNQIAFPEAYQAISVAWGAFAISRGIAKSGSKQ